MRNVNAYSKRQFLQTCEGIFSLVKTRAASLELSEMVCRAVVHVMVIYNVELPHALSVSQTFGSHISKNKPAPQFLFRLKQHDVRRCGSYLCPILGNDLIIGLSI